MRKTIGVLAHVDAGKTTLSEALLLESGTLRRAGRVDHGDTLLDADAQERARGITIYADQSPFSHGGHDYTLIDTPGHVDFAPAMERSLAVLDAAVLVISAADGVQGHTQTIWRALAARAVPTFVFVNKCDRADAAETLRDIARTLSDDCVDVTGGLASAAEELAARDEALLERYLAQGFDEAAFVRVARDMVRTRSLFPLVRGAALAGDGVGALLTALDTLLETSYDENAPLGAQVYGVRRLPSGERLALLKITGGTLHARDLLGQDKVGETRLVRGAKTENLPQAPAGLCCAALGLAHARIGDGLGAAPALPPCLLTPLLSARAQFDCPPQQALAAFRALEDEEPALSVDWEEQTRQLTVRIMGRVQLEVLTEALRVRFGLKVDFAPPEVAYRETLLESTTGIGHFEPLRHYAEVVLRLSPAPRGSGITFASECRTDDLAANWQNLIRTHVFERQHRGVLTGAPLTDICITLLRGRAHEKHTEGGDFREAVYRAIRQGLMGAKSAVLEPRLRLTATVEPALVGRLLSDLQKMHGEAEAPSAHGARTRVCALVPLAAWGDYPAEFAAYTHGRGALCVEPGDWTRCHNEKEVVERAAYEPTRDLAHTPDSVFCSHGAGYPVKWDAVPAHCHCKE